jgi:hypothetical protein
MASWQETRPCLEPILGKTTSCTRLSPTLSPLCRCSCSCRTSRWARPSTPASISRPPSQLLFRRTHSPSPTRRTSPDGASICQPDWNWGFSRARRDARPGTVASSWARWRSTFPNRLHRADGHAGARQRSVVRGALVGAERRPRARRGGRPGRVLVAACDRRSRPVVRLRPRRAPDQRNPDGAECRSMARDVWPTGCLQRRARGGGRARALRPARPRREHRRRQSSNQSEARKHARSTAGRGRPIISVATSLKLRQVAGA